VSVLVYGLKQEDRPDLQVRCGDALGRMGPLAWKAVPELTDTLRKTRSPRQQRVVVGVLKQFGRAARPAAPVLENLAAAGPAEVRGEAREALRSICVPAWLGVNDTARVLSERSRRRVNERSLELARKHHFQFVAETVPSLPQAPAGIKLVSADGAQRALADLASKRCRAAGAERGLFVLICNDPPAVHVTLGQDARAQASPRLTEQAVSELIQTHLKRKDQEKGLEEAVGFVEQALASGK
jgi:hypothetical protein